MKLNKIGFIGCGPWGAVFLQDPGLFKNCALDLILAVDSINGNHFEKMSKSRAIHFYSSKESYAVFEDKKLDAIMMAGWPYKISANFINSISCPIINIHPSLLPKYRGPEPIIQQLLHDETQSGVTLHKIDQNFDTGPICVQVGFKIEQDDDNRTLFFKAARAGKKAVELFLEKVRMDRLTFSPQAESEATYHPKLNILDFVINEAASKAVVLRISRACYGQYPLVCNFQNQLFFLVEFKIHDSLNTNKPVIRLKDGFLELIKYVPVEKTSQ